MFSVNDIKKVIIVADIMTGNKLFFGIYEVFKNKLFTKITKKNKNLNLIKKASWFYINKRSNAF